MLAAQTTLQQCLFFCSGFVMLLTLPADSNTALFILWQGVPSPEDLCQCFFWHVLPGCTKHSPHKNCSVLQFCGRALRQQCFVCTVTLCVHKVARAALPTTFVPWLSGLLFALFPHLPIFFMAFGQWVLSQEKFF